MENHVVKFHEMGLDDRILKAISELGWREPTLIQEKAIPLALQGKDILSRARTGSGKTAAFAIPIIQKILHLKQIVTVQEIRALVLAPSKELCKQIHKHFQELTRSCSQIVRSVDVSTQVELTAQRPLLIEKPDIIVGTPSRVLAHFQNGNIQLTDAFQMLVIDEADMIFSFGFEDNVRQILKHIPSTYQALLMSATLSPDVHTLRKIVLQNPVVLKLEEPELQQTSQLMQYHIHCEEEDKFVLIYALFKLKLIRGKTIIFVNSVDKCYKVKLFLEQFGINCCVLNSELPATSRCHIVHQFNEGLYDIIVASDEKAVEDPLQGKQKKRKKVKRDKEYGVSRGIDFQFVSNIINLDFPPSVEAYIHRVGRTARGANTGTALSLVSVKEQDLMALVEKSLSLSDSESGSIFKPYQFKMEEIEGFRYRAKDAVRAVTRIAIREARLKEIKKELLNSHKLKSYFEDNPRDLQLLRHDKALHIVKQQPHLKNVPDYIVPPTLKKLVHEEQRLKRKRKFQQPEEAKRPPTKSQRRFKKKQSDPLQSFQYVGTTQKK